MKQLWYAACRGLAGLILNLWGWKIKGDFPQHLNQFIVIVAPHRKGFPDVLLGWCVKELKPIPAQRFLVKYEAYHNFWYGWIMKYLGGIPIDRKRQYDPSVPKGQYVQNIKAMVATGERMTIVITPEGTRTPNAPWKRGFYQLALGTQLPVVPALFNYDEKIVEIGSPMIMSGNVAYDVSMIYKWYDLRSVSRYIPVIHPEDFK